MGNSHGDRPGGPPRPREFLRSAECSAVRIRKLLRAKMARRPGSGSSESTHDAVRLVELIEHLARHGQKVPAAEAVRLAEYVEITISMLAAEFDDFLA